MELVGKVKIELILLYLVSKGLFSYDKFKEDIVKLKVEILI